MTASQHSTHTPFYFKIIVILCLISSLPRFVLDSYLPSLPAIGQIFDISDSTTQLTLTYYLLGFSFSQLIYGPLSDHYGRRLTIIIGLTVFAAGNLICTISPSSNWLIFARFIAGIGAGSCGVLNRAIASDCFKGVAFSKAWSYTTSTLVITLCIAPVIGGYVQEILGWRANFIISMFFVVSVLGIILKFLPETNLKMTAEQENIPAPSISEIATNYKTIFATPSFITNVLCYTLAFSGLIAYFQVSPILLINGLGLLPSQYGWCSVLIAVNYLLGGLIVNKFAGRFGTHYLLMFGALLLIIGGAFMLLAHGYLAKNVFTILLPAAIYVLGARIVIPNAIAGSMEMLRHLNGSTSALIGFVQMLGSSFISFYISRFNNESVQPLAIFLTVIGCLALTCSFMSKPGRMPR